MKLNKIAIVFSLLTVISCSEEGNTEGEVAEVNGHSNNAIDNTSNQPVGNVIISGQMEGATSSTVYLYKYGVNPPLTLDSNQLDANGNFSFNFSQQGFGFVGIGIQPNSAALFLVGPGDEISVEGSATNWVRDYSVSGSGYSDDIREYLLMRQEYTDKITVLKNELSAIPKTDVAAQQKINEKGIAMQDEFVGKRNEFIKKMDDTPALYIALQDIYDPVSDIEELRAISKATNKYMPNSIFAEQTNTILTQAEQQVAFAEQQSTSQGSVGVGKPAPELSFATPEGKMLSLSSLKGKVVLLDFWASWCKPCRMENPNVVKLYNQYKDKGFTVYSVSLDNNKSKWVDAIAADGLVWPNHVSDLGGWNSMPAAIYGVNSIPQTYLIDADGIIIAKDLRGEDLANKLKEILG